MEQKSLLKTSVRLPGFVEQAFDSIEKMKEYSKLLLDSRIVPDHYYEKGANNKPDYTKGNVPKVMMVLQKGYQLDIDPQMALEVIVPINGVLSIKGNAAKALIMRSGKVVKGSWIEKITGTLKDENYTVSITAQRVDTGEKLTREFSIDKAKRSGLWISDDMLKGQDGWKFKYSPWYRFQERMIYHRALGNLANDLFGDVINNMYTTEEAQDIPQEQSVEISTEKGIVLHIPDKEFNKERSQNLTSKASEKIDKVNKSSEKPQIVTEEIKEKIKESATQEEKVATIENNEGLKDELRTEAKAWEEMDQKELFQIVEGNNEMKSANDILDPKKSTKPKLLRIIQLYHEGQLSEAVEKFVKQKEKIQANKESQASEEKEESTTQGELQMEAMDNNEEDEDREFPQGREDDITPNEDFEVEKKSAGQSPLEQLTSNKHGIEVPELPDTEEKKRDFKQVNTLYNEMGKLGIDNKAFENIVKNKLPGLNNYSNKELFCFTATAHEINLLLNTI